MLVSISLTPSILENSLVLAPEVEIAEYENTKRVFDLVVASVLLVCTSPLILLAALAVKLSSPGNIIFKQKRLTQDSKAFTMYKFRTMRNDAEKATGATWAEEEDPRITKIGKLLRKTRIDELPQLLNVIKGEMSMIGPRPERPELVQELSEELPRFKRRLEAKAGITGLAQIEYGYAGSIDEYREKLKWDLKYVDSRSITMDLIIAIKTIPVMITGYGAR